MTHMYYPLQKCVDKTLYAISGRNASIGLFNAADGSFSIVRVKLGHEYLSKEFHYDTGPPHGTVKPLLELEHVTNEQTLMSFLSNHPKSQFCQKLNRKYIELERGVRIPAHLKTP